jgi:hypothetical protein
MMPTLPSHRSRSRAATGAAVCLILATASAGLAADVQEAPALSFCQAPFVHPLVVKELMTWISDGGDQIVAINLLDSNDSNRYYGDIKTQPPGELAPLHPKVFNEAERTAEGEQDERFLDRFGYQYVGLTRSGVHVLLTWNSGAGTMVEMNLLLLSVEEDRGLGDVDTQKGSQPLRLDRRRLLLRKLGEIALGDRWEGELRVDGNAIFVGRDRGWFADPHSEPYNKKDLVLTLEDQATRPGLLRPCP